MAGLSRERSLKYLQLEFFKLREFCIEQGLIKRTRRLTPVGAASRNLMDLGMAEDVSFRLFGQVLRSMFDDCQVSKQRNLAEYVIKLPEGDWCKDDTNERILQEFHPDLDPCNLPDNLGRYVSLRSEGYPAKPRLRVGVDGKTGASRYNNRRREDTLLKNGRPVTDFHAAARAAVEWKKLMDARMEAFRTPAPTDSGPVQNDEDTPVRDTTGQAAFEEAARRISDERE